MAAFGQTFDSNAWLLRSSRQAVYPRIDAGANSSAGDVVWVAWWLNTWVYATPTTFDQGRMFRSTWLSNPLQAYPRVWPLLQRERPQVGYTVWNNWFFNTPYIAPQKLAIFAGVGPYHYVGKAANLGGLHRYNLVLAGGVYEYVGSVGHSDIGIDADVIPYSLQGQDVSTGGGKQLVAATGHYLYSGESANFRHLITGYTGLILTTLTRAIQGPKRVSEVVSPAFDFSPKVTTGDTLSNLRCVISVWSGVDPNPMAMLVGLTSAGYTVFPTLQGGVGGTIYQMNVEADASLSGTLTILAFLAVLPDGL